MSFLQSFEGGNIILDLNEVRMISGPYVLFKGTDKLYDIGKENADAVRKTFRYHSDEQQQDPPAKTDPVGLMELSSHVV